MTAAAEADPQQQQARALWRAGDLIGFAAEFHRAHRDRFSALLLSAFRLDTEDVEDAISVAVQELLTRHASDPGLVDDPLAYTFTTARYECIRAISNRKRGRGLTVDDLPPDAADNAGQDEGGDGIAPSVDEVAEAPAFYLVEEILPESEVDSSWAVPVIAAAISMLPRTEARVASHFVTYSGMFDPTRNTYEITSPEAAAELGMTPDAFRKAKSRAFKKLSEAIPTAIRELGLKPPARQAEAIFTAAWRGPSDA